MDELVRGLRSGEPLWCEIIEGGLALYQRGDTGDQLRAVVGEVKAEYGLERIRGGWRWSKG